MLCFSKRWMIAAAVVAGGMAHIGSAGAQTWQQHWKMIPAPHNIMQVRFLNEQYGFVETNADSLFRTTDAGASWEPITCPGLNINFIRHHQLYDFFFLTPAHLFVALVSDGTMAQDTNTGIFESRDSGITWRRITGGLVSSVSYRDVYASADSIWGASGINLGTAVQLTTDDGQTWSEGYAGVFGNYLEWFDGNRAGTLVASFWADSIDPITSSESFQGEGTAFSSNGGSTWTPTHTTLGWSRYLYGPYSGWQYSIRPYPTSCCLLPGTNTMFFTENYDSIDWYSYTPVGYGGLIYRSTDNGSHFLETDSIPRIQLGEIEGAAGSCSAVYVEKIDSSSPDPGFLRTTDGGATWQNIDGPKVCWGIGLYYNIIIITGDELESRTSHVHSFSVLGRGAIVYACDSLGNLWLTTDGGDGLLTSAVPPSLRSFSLTAGDTITTTLCALDTIEFRASYTGCDRIWIDSSQIDGFGQNGYYTILDNRPLTDTSAPDTAAIVLVPLKPGAYSLTVHGRVREEDFLVLDTTLHVTVIIRPNPGILDLSAKPLYDFGTQALCAPVTLRDSFLLASHGCEPVTVDSMILRPDSTQFKDFTFKSSTSAFHPDSTPTKFPISFKPSIVGTETGMILIYWSDGETQHIDTIHLQGSGALDVRSFNIQKNINPARLCDSTEESLAITNTTCGKLVIDSVFLPDSTTLPFVRGRSQIPLSILSGGTGSLILHFSPGNSLPFHAGDTTLPVSLQITYIDHGDTSSFDTLVALPIHIDSGAPIAAYSTENIHFGTVSLCDTSQFPLILSSTGCGALSTIEYKVSGRDGFGIRDSGVTSLPSGTSDTIYALFHPMNSNRALQDTLTITSNAGVDTVLLDGMGASSFGLPITSLNFGTFARCNARRDTNVWLTNLSCDSLAVSSASVSSGTGFTLVSGGDTTLAPNQSATFQIAFSDSVAGSYASALHIHTIGAHGGSEVDTTIPLSATIVEGSKLARLNTQAITFDTTSICEELDSSITITNTGCEPDTITAISLANGSFACSASLPIILLPNGDTSITIVTRADTTGHAGANADTLRFTANLDAPLAPVVLSRGLGYPGSFALGLASQESAAPGANVPVYILRSGTVPVAANELDFAIAYNDNLLSYRYALEPDIATTDSQIFPNGLTERSFAMKPAMDRDTIATLEFESYLAKDQHTPITLSGQQFLANGETSPPCVASLDTNALAAGFTLILACGDSTIMLAMDGLPFHITSLEVSPEQLIFTISRADARYGSCTAELLNVLGTQETETSIALEPVTTGRFALGTLPSGTYFLRVATGGYVITRRFVIMK